MKKLILLFGLILISVAIMAQRGGLERRTLTIPVGADSTTAVKFFTGHSWSAEINASGLDGVDTLSLYSAAHSDSTTYNLIWVDQDLDGVNDNPWTLSTTLNLSVWGESFPFRYLIYYLKKGTSTAGLGLVVDEMKQ